MCWLSPGADYLLAEQVCDFGLSVVLPANSSAVSGLQNGGCVCLALDSNNHQLGRDLVKRHCKSREH
jgi:hypothetical protein